MKMFRCLLGLLLVSAGSYVSAQESKPAYPPPGAEPGVSLAQAKSERLDRLIDKANAILEKHPGNARAGMGFQGLLYTVGVSDGSGVPHLKQVPVAALVLTGGSIFTKVARDGSRWYALLSPGHNVMDDHLGGFYTKEDAEAMKAVILEIQEYMRTAR